VDESELLPSLRERAERDLPGYGAMCPPISEADLRDSEDSLGFRLPGFVRRLYTEVGNGGFGPGYGGVLGLAGGASNDS
jgi:hypothetical protein